MNNSLNLAIRKVSRELCIDYKIVEAVYKSYWLFIKTQITSTPLKDISEEEFNATDTNFNLPYLGKLYVEYEKIEKNRRRLKYLENVKAEKNKANRLPSTSD